MSNIDEVYASINGPQRLGEPLGPENVMGPFGERKDDHQYHTTWRAYERGYIIVRPNTNEPLMEYPGITFQAGDRVRIAADGCSQTGGSGKTWKRYVDPRGDNANRFYHGLAWIPGALPWNLRTDPALRIQDIANVTLLVTAPCALQIGFEDDNFEDNGYWGRAGDDGTGDQCKGLRDFANVVIDIDRGPSPIPAFEPASYVFDVDTVEIFNTRSSHNDTNTVTISVTVDDKAAVENTVSMGDVNNGVFKVNARTPPIRVENPTTKVALTYLVLNKGFDPAILNTIKNGLAELATKAVEAAIAAELAGPALPAGAAEQAPKENPLAKAFSAAGDMIKAIFSETLGVPLDIIFANCDGPVAGELVVLTGQQLWDLTHTSPRDRLYECAARHPGTDSSAGCGDNSDYRVKWQIVRF